jgi:hypothetical protein
VEGEAAKLWKYRPKPCENVAKTLWMTGLIFCSSRGIITHGPKPVNAVEDFAKQ